MKVHVVEDDPIYGPALCRALGRLGFEATLSTTIEEALDEPEPHPLALIDLNLPDGSGIEVVRVLAARGAQVVVLTGHGSINAAVQCMREGATDFLTKPVSTEEVGMALQKALEAAGEPLAEPGSERLDDVERAHILAILNDCDGNISEAARRLGLYRRTLQRKLQKL